MLHPCYGLGMHQAVAFLLVPYIPLIDKKTVKKFTTYFTLYQILYSLQFQFYIYILPKMWCLERIWVVWRLNINICTKLIEIN